MIVINNRKVLLVEDNILIQKVHTSMLEACGYVVELAQNGAEAISCFENDCYDAIIMDIKMPKVDGITATRRIRHLEGNREKRTPLLILTAHEEDRKEALDAGADDYATKPISQGALRQRLEYLISV